VFKNTRLFEIIGDIRITSPMAVGVRACQTVMMDQLCHSTGLIPSADGRRRIEAGILTKTRVKI
jgi:hypothetical protein